MNIDLPKSRSSRIAAEEIRAALRHYAYMSRWSCKAQISVIDGHIVSKRGEATSPAVRVDLTSEDALMLAALLRSPGLPDYVASCTPLGRPSAAPIPDPTPGSGWLDTLEVANLIGNAPSTIRAWIARGGPKHHPFPAPCLRRPHHNFWRKAVVEEWLTQEARIMDNLKKSRKGRQ